MEEVPGFPPLKTDVGFDGFVFVLFFFALPCCSFSLFFLQFVAMFLFTIFYFSTFLCYTFYFFNYSFLNSHCKTKSCAITKEDCFLGTSN